MSIAVTTGWKRYGAAAALLAIGVAPAAAQTARGARRADTIRTTRMIQVETGRMARLIDSVRVLMRVFDDEPITSPQSDTIRRKVEAIVLSLDQFAAPGRDGRDVYVERVLRPLTSRGVVRGGRGTPVRGWIGITTTGLTPHKEWIDGAHFVQYFDHPLVASVDRGSPAQRAGIMPGDTVIAYDGQDVIGRVINLTEMLTPDRTLAVTVRRKGETREYPVLVGRPPLRVVMRYGASATGRAGVAAGFSRAAPARPAGDDDAPVVTWTGAAPGLQLFTFGNKDGSIFVFPKAGLFGASLMTVEPPLAQSIGLRPGVLVREVAEGMPAARAGLRVGDLVVAAGGRSVASLSELQQAAMKRADERTLTLQVIRDRKPRTITVTW